MEGLRLIEMYEYENDLFQKGYYYVAGCDEAGRGPLAGPVVAAAVILDRDYEIKGLNDSKKLTDKKRRLLYKEIIEHAKSYAITFIDVFVIDEINILEAARKAMIDSIKDLNIVPDFIITDAMKIPYENSLDIIKGDALSATIAAASILAKVTRDDYMIELDKKYPLYGFKSHKGYGTKRHIEAIKNYGIINGVHRLTFEPIKSMVKNVEQMSLDL